MLYNLPQSGVINANNKSWKQAQRGYLRRKLQKADSWTRYILNYEPVLLF